MLCYTSAAQSNLTGSTALGQILDAIFRAFSQVPRFFAQKGDA